MMLHCENLVPIILVESDNWNKDENVQLEYTEILYRSDRFSFQLTNTEKKKDVSVKRGILFPFTKLHTSLMVFYLATRYICIERGARDEKSFKNKTIN